MPLFAPGEYLEGGPRTPGLATTPGAARLWYTLPAPGRPESRLRRRWAS